MSNLRDAVHYILTNFHSITSFYDQDFRFNGLKLKTYKANQKGLSEIARRLIYGSKKYGRDPKPKHSHETIPETLWGRRWQPLPSTDKIDEDANARRHHYILAYVNGSWGNIRSKLPASSKQLLRHLTPPPAPERLQYICRHGGRIPHI
jgi:hypothetical protein